MKSEVRHLSGRGAIRAATLGLTFLVGIAGAAAAQRQGVARGHDDSRGGPRIGQLQVTIEDLDTGTWLQPIAPKDVAVIRVGQRVRLRMTALPVGAGAGTRYPSTRFNPNQSRYLRIDKLNPEVGTILVTGLQPHGATGAVPIIYEILEPWPMADELRSARIYVKVVADAQPPTPEPQPIVRGSVVFFQDDDFRGGSQEFWEGVDRMAGTQIGNDSVSSLRVSPGCSVHLYEHELFRGRVTVVTSDTRTLRGSTVGNDTVSSFRLDCSAMGAGRGVTLFADDSFRGSSEKFLADASDLGDYPRIGNDRASSVRVDPGCEAWLFDDAGFGGTSLYVTGDVPALARTTLGNDRASSLRVRCNN
ncbi:MAG TPA: beta/gamma crystallin-related protein [Thermoanaerobaculia bacterium]|nr:beta/gamma crystallin-related protein [Thermoanaerobaculia bacterium]